MSLQRIGQVCVVALPAAAHADAPASIAAAGVNLCFSQRQLGGRHADIAAGSASCTQAAR